MQYNPKTKAYDIPASGTQLADQSNAILDDYLSRWEKMNELEKVMPSQITQALPGLFPDKAYLDTAFYTQLEPLLRKSVVGGRITQQELTWLQNALPKSGDTNESAAAKIQAIKNALDSKVSNPNYQIGGSSSNKSNNNDPLGIL